MPGRRDRPSVGDWIVHRGADSLTGGQSSSAPRHVGRVKGITRLRSGESLIYALPPRSDDSERPVPLEHIEGIIRPGTQAGTRLLVDLLSDETTSPGARKLLIGDLAQSPGLAGDGEADSEDDTASRHAEERARRGARARAAILRGFASVGDA